MIDRKLVEHCVRTGTPLSPETVTALAEEWLRITRRDAELSELFAADDWPDEKTAEVEVIKVRYGDKTATVK